ncbi:MAG: DUF1987 domain-containing protein [Flavobacteriales bacterium]|nr:DUF1987 domain-containing protein [Flavobacteriales bacterium]NNK81046.1 DUF1987 domain-containing protein [Flavobacteriales bacterium]
MEDINIEGSPKTPEVRFSASEGQFLLSGRSIPENSVEFYSSILNWLDQYSESPRQRTVLDVKLEYFNTSSSKCILDVFKKLEQIKNDGNDVNVNWFYESDDEDMLEAGEDYDAIIDIAFTMKEVEGF